MTANQNRVLEALRVHPAGAALLAHLLGGSRQNMLQRLRGLAVKGMVEQTPTGAHWQLTAQGRATLPAPPPHGQGAAENPLAEGLPPESKPAFRREVHAWDHGSEASASATVRVTRDGDFVEALDANPPA